MRCAWKQLLSVLPLRIRPEVDRLGKDSLQEIRLRLHAPPQLIIKGQAVHLNGAVSQEDIQFCINAASQYSPWAAVGLDKGYITAPGGHRIGLCGEVVCKDGKITGIKNVRSLCIRVARDISGIGNSAPKEGSVLILGAPGWGKTTLLRDLIRNRSDRGVQTGVLDERGELFPDVGFPCGGCTDILTGCKKAEGIQILLRTMGPMCIAVDEITEPEDCTAMLQAAGCGVTLLATAHASDMQDFKKRNVYRQIIERQIFDHVLVLRPDKSWYTERMHP